MKLKLIVQHCHVFIDENGNKVYKNKPNNLSRECLVVMARRTWLGIFRNTLIVSIHEYATLEVAVNEDLEIDQRTIKAFNDYLNTNHFTVRKVYENSFCYRLNLIYRKNNSVVSSLSQLQTILEHLSQTRLSLLPLWN